MLTNKTQTQIDKNYQDWNKWIAANYETERNELIKACYYSTYTYSDDMFHEAILSISNAILRGTKVKIKKAHDYLFITFKNCMNAQTGLAYNKHKDESNDFERLLEYNDVPDTSVEASEEKEESFQEQYKMLVRAEHDVRQHCSKKVSEIFTKKFNGEVLNTKAGEKRYWEKAKQYVKANYTDEYNKIKAKYKNERGMERD